MSVPRLAFLACAALLVCSGGALAAAPDPALPSGWSHAQVNVIGPGGRPHTLIYDRGRIQSVGPASVTLAERDGSIVTVQVAPNAVVRLNARRVVLDTLAPGDTVTTLGVDGRPAIRVVANRTPRGAGRVPVRPLHSR